MVRARLQPHCKVKVKALKPGFIRAHRLGPVTMLQAKAKIERTAALMAVTV